MHVLPHQPLNDPPLQLLASCAVGSARTVYYSVEFPDEQLCPSKGELSNSKEPLAITVTLDPDQTVLDVMTTAAENLYAEVESSAFNFNSTYYGSISGFFVTSIGGCESTECCYWSFQYRMPGSDTDTVPSLGVSSVTPGDRWLIKMKYVFNKYNKKCPSQPDKEEL